MGKAYIKGLDRRTVEITPEGGCSFTLNMAGSSVFSDHDLGGREIDLVMEEDKSVGYLVYYQYVGATVDHTNNLYRIRVLKFHADYNLEKAMESVGQIVDQWTRETLDGKLLWKSCSDDRIWAYRTTISGCGVTICYSDWRPWIRLDESTIYPAYLDSQCIAKIMVLVEAIDPQFRPEGRRDEPISLDYSVKGFINEFSGEKQHDLR